MEEHSITTGTSVAHAKPFDDATTDENARSERSPSHESNSDSSSNSSNMKYEQISSEYQPYQVDTIQPIITIKHTSSTTTTTTTTNDTTTETSQSHSIEAASTTSSQPDQSKCETNDNDTFDTNECVLPSSSAISDMANSNSVPNNVDAEHECNSDVDPNDAIRMLQSKHVRDELDLFCYVCNYGFKSFPRLIRHMETKKHANQVEKYHSMNSRQCFSAVPMVGCDQYRNGYRTGPVKLQPSPPSPPQPLPRPHLLLPSMPPHQVLYQLPYHHRQQHPYHHHHPFLLRHQPQTIATIPMTATTTTTTTTTTTMTSLGHGDMELLPEDVINQMIDSLGDDVHSNSDAFTEFETTDLSEMLEYLQ